MTLALLTVSAQWPTSAGFLFILLCLSQKSKDLPCIGKIPIFREMRILAECPAWKELSERGSSACWYRKGFWTLPCYRLVPHTRGDLVEG